MEPSLSRRGAYVTSLALQKPLSHSSAASTLTTMIATSARSSLCKGPKRNNSRPTGQSNTKASSASVTAETHQSARLPLPNTSAREVVKERLTTTSPRSSSTKETKVSARASPSGRPRRSAREYNKPSGTSAAAPCSKLQTTRAGEKSGLVAARGGRAITSASAGSASNTIEHTGSMTIS